jgi:hypothetical protein
MGLQAQFTSVFPFMVFFGVLLRVLHGTDVPHFSILPNPILGAQIWCDVPDWAGVLRILLIVLFGFNGVWLEVEDGYPVASTRACQG